MKILFVLHERNNGGACKCALTLMEELRGKGHNVIAVIPIRFGTLRAALEENNVPYRIVFFAWWMMPSYWNGVYKLFFRILHALDRIAVLRISRLIRKEKIDIVHSNTSVIDVGARAAVRTGTPHVWHVREYGDKGLNLEFLAGKDESCRYMNSVPGVILFVSRALREHYFGFLSDEKCQVIYDGIPESYAIEKEHRKDDGTVFLIAGNIQENKGQHQALGAAGLLYKRGYRNFRLWIAGSATAMKASREYEHQLKRMASDISDDMIVFKGYINDMKSLRRDTDVELVCSSYEAFGRITVEAMLASNPVIATDTGASPELLEPGKTGYLYHYGNVEELADLMERFIKFPESLKIMGEFGKKRAMDKFLSEKGTNSIEAIYKKLIKDSESIAKRDKNRNNNTLL